MKRKTLVSLLVATCLLDSIPENCFCAAYVRSPPSVINKTDANPVLRTVSKVELLGHFSIPTGHIFNGTEVGGLSGLAYDEAREWFYALSDDRGDPRFYTLEINITSLVAGDDGNGSRFNETGLVFRRVTSLRDLSGKSFPPGILDPEGIALGHNGALYVASEGDVREGTPPSVMQFTLTGYQRANEALDIPDYFAPEGNGTLGIRNNKGFESLAITPDWKHLWTASENALAQDGPASDVNTTSLVRMLRLGPTSATPYPSGSYPIELVYESDAVPSVPNPPDAYRDNGLVELVVIDDEGSFLALERSYSAGVGNNIRLYEVLTRNALNVSGLEDLTMISNDTGEENGFVGPKVEKRLLVDFEADLGVVPDNLEAMALVLDEATEDRGKLVVVSDNNFNPLQKTQFILLDITFATNPSTIP